MRTDLQMLGAALALGALGACSGTPRPRIDNPKPVEVAMPVPVACVRREDIPARPELVGGQLNGNARHDADILAAALNDVRSIADRALALLDGCTE